MSLRRGRAPREQLVAELFAEHHDRILGMVERRVTPGHYAADGCAYAWGRLLERPEVRVDDDRTPGWVFQVALRESWKLSTRQRDQTSLDTRDGDRKDQYERVADHAPGPHERAVMREKLALVDELPARRQQALRMSAAGFSYDEMREHAGMSHTSVNRYLTESRAKLRVLDRERSLTPTEREQRPSPTTPDLPPTREHPTPAPVRQQPQRDLGIEL